jgi:rare lipoprotein A
MRKGSTSLGSLGMAPAAAGVILLILPICVAGAVVAPRPGQAAEAMVATDEQDQAIRTALEKRILKGTARGEVRVAPALADRALKVIHTRATWYGPGFHGRRTASGEIFNRNAMTLASRHLPFGTRVRVINPRTGRAAVARVNDRGPFRSGYTADLSQALARRIGLGGSGAVRLEILARSR